MNNEFPNDTIANAMKHSLVEMPFSDFDQRMMQQIRKEAIALEKTRKDKNNASLFFVLGCFFGMCCSGILVMGKQANELFGFGLKSVLQATSVILLFLFLNGVYKLFIKLKKPRLTGPF